MAITGDGLRVDGVGHLLTDKKSLAVPTNQRSYAWEKDQVTDFWQDIRGAKDDKPEYFIGSMVLSESPGRTPEIVDGQQRLATTTMILAAIRDYYAEHPNEGDAVKRVQVIEGDFLAATDDNLKPVARLTLGAADNAFFKEHVADASIGPRKSLLDAKPKVRLKESHKNIAVAAKVIRGFVFDYVKDMRPDQASKRLWDLMIFIRDKVKIIAVTVPNHDDAYTIFETLNDRGLDLSKSDLLKNHLFRAAGNREKEVEHSWHRMTAALEVVSKKDLSVDYIRYYWISRRGHVRGKELYTRIRKDVFGESAAVELAESLADDAIVYASLLNSDHSRWSEYGDDARADLSNLIMLGIERLQPITLAVARSFSTTEAKKALYYLVCASVRILIASPSPGGTFEGQVADVAPLIRDKLTPAEQAAPNKDEIAKRLIRTTKALAEAMNRAVVPGDKVFESQFAVAKVSQDQLARYYLRALNTSIADAAEKWPARVTKRDTKSNIEHILPKELSGWWNHITEDECDVLLRRIGNLTLLSPPDNSMAGNKDFETVKLPIYRDSGFGITSAIADFGVTVWNEEAIDKRQKDLAAKAVKVWPSKSS
jgi:hypothetical protein